MKYYAFLSAPVKILSVLLGFCFVFFIGIRSDCLKKLELARGTGFIRLICKLADNLSTSCRYADFRPSLKNKTVNEFC